MAGPCCPSWTRFGSGAEATWSAPRPDPGGRSTRAPAPIRNSGGRCEHAGGGFYRWLLGVKGFRLNIAAVSLCRIERLASQMFKADPFTPKSTLLGGAPARLPRPVELPLDMVEERHSIDLFSQPSCRRRVTKKVCQLPKH